MALVALARTTTFHGWDIDLDIAVRNQSLKPVTVTFVRALARRGDQGFRCELLPDDRALEEDEDQHCASHWLPWRSSASHLVRIYEAGFVPESITLVVRVRGQQHVLEVDTAHLQTPMN